jgi:hypothetical protein
MSTWEELFALARPAFAQQRTFVRAKHLAASSLACLGRRTLSGVLCAAGQQFVDWSAAYRLFEQERLDLPALWQLCLQQTGSALPASSPVVALLDDTLVHKRGRHVAGTSWRRDPLGPHFSTNFVWANRFLQLSLALPSSPQATIGPARGIPINLQHAPTPRKPKLGPDPTKNQAALKKWNQQKAASAISRLGNQHIRALRTALDQLPVPEQRSLLVCADATFTNRTVLKNFPSRTALIGRVRKDACLYALPTPQEQNSNRGRCRLYGRKLPTPEQYRREERIQWTSIQAFAASKVYPFDVKYIAPLRWKAAGSRQLGLLIVRPVSYFLRRGAARARRQPAYLICTDLTLTPQQILQAYLWRWEIELNFRDEKTLAGLGDAQMRTDTALRTIAAFTVFTYALLLLALHRCGLAHSPLPRPRWQQGHVTRTTTRITTPQALSLFRSEIWASALGLPNKSGFVAPLPAATKPQNCFTTLQSAVLFASG